MGLGQGRSRKPPCTGILLSARWEREQAAQSWESGGSVICFREAGRKAEAGWLPPLQPPRGPGKPGRSECRRTLKKQNVSLNASRGFVRRILNDSCPRGGATEDGPGFVPGGGAEGSENAQVTWLPVGTSPLQPRGIRARGKGAGGGLWAVKPARAAEDASRRSNPDRKSVV